MRRGRVDWQSGLTLLYFGIAPNKLVKALRARLGAVRGKGQVVVLEVETNSGKIDLALYAGIFELFRVA